MRTLNVNVARVNPGDTITAIWSDIRQRWDHESHFYVRSTSQWMSPGGVRLVTVRGEHHHQQRTYHADTIVQVHIGGTE